MLTFGFMNKILCTFIQVFDLYHSKYTVGSACYRIQISILRTVHLDKGYIAELEGTGPFLEPNNLHNPSVYTSVYCYDTETIPIYSQNNSWKTIKTHIVVQIDQLDMVEALRCSARQPSRYRWKIFALIHCERIYSTEKA